MGIRVDDLRGLLGSLEAMAEEVERIECPYVEVGGLCRDELEKLRDIRVQLDRLKLAFVYEIGEVP